jgi:hypothetical protein
VPEHFKVSLFDGENVKPTPYRSKAVGEPPLMLALSAFFAVRDAVSASAGHQVPVDLDAPATPERILLACERRPFATGWKSAVFHAERAGPGDLPDRPARHHRQATRSDRRVRGGTVVATPAGKTLNPESGMAQA